MIPAIPLLALALMGGTVAAAAFGGPWWLTALVAALLMAAARMLDRGRASVAVLIAAVAFASAGHARFDAAETAPPRPLATISGQHEVVGTAVADARLRGAVATLDLDVERVDGALSAGRLRLTLRVENVAPRAGDRIRASGEVRRAPRSASSDYVAYLQDTGIDAVLAYPSRWAVIDADTGVAPIRALRAARRWATANIERSLPEPSASLVAGVLLGEQRTMPRALTEALRLTGTTHLVVVSGQNVAMLTGALVALLALALRRRRAALLTLALLPGYVLLVGADPPVVRAALMAVGITIAGASGRRTPAWIFLIYACAGMLALDPLLARSVSFQLSAAATAGVLIIAPLLTERVAALVAGPSRPGGALLASMAEAAAVAVGAAIAVIPVQAAAFGSLSLVQVPVNALLAPIYGATVAVAILAALLGWLWPVAELLRATAQFVPAAFIGLVSLMARVPGASITVQAPSIAWISWYLLAGAGVWLANKRQPAELGGAGAGVPGATIALAMVAGCLWFAALLPSDATPSVTVLDVGQGLAVLVRDGGAAVLIDTGPPDGAVLAALTRAGQSRPLSAVVITHADADHAGGLPAVRQRIGTTRTLAAAGVSPGAERIDIGDRIRLSARTTIEVLAPPVATLPRTLASENDRALVVLVTIGERCILLPADIEAAGEHWLATSGLDLRADVLVVPHHGSKTSSTPAFLAAVEPRAAVISVGARNSYGHPNPEVLARYGTIGMYRTDTAGEVTLRSDGTRLWVQAARATLPAQHNGGTR